MYSDYIILIDDVGQPYIAHHGIKGQRWGVRRFQNEDGSLTAAGSQRLGRKAKKAQKVYDRIHSIRDDEKRMNRMSGRQKQSLENAENYWKAKAEGRKPTERRGIIKREADRWRSHSLKERAGIHAGISAVGFIPAAVGSTAVRKLAGDSAGRITMDLGRAAVGAALTTAEALGADEVTNVIFGHF